MHQGIQDIGTVLCCTYIQKFCPSYKTATLGHLVVYVSLTFPLHDTNDFCTLSHFHFSWQITVVDLWNNFFFRLQATRREWKDGRLFYNVQ